MTFGRNLQEARERRAAEKEANLLALCSKGLRLHRGTYAGATTAADPKSVERRNSALLALAKDRPCLLMIPAVCNHRTDSTVACHSNLSIHGKAGARKADDHYSVWGCAACHYWLDFGKAAAAQKEMAFMLAHARQALAWRLIARDRQEPVSARRAAQWALDLLNATPLAEEAR
jgi:hypothetical protein